MKTISTMGLIAAGAAVALGGCASGSRTPDEFRVVRKAPLTIPPDYNLRPPSPGESRPTELEPDAQARAALFGQELGANATDGERLLVKKAGGEAVDRAIRAAVDYDTSQVLHKNKSFADRILFFKKDEAPADPTLDATAEAERLRAEKAADEAVTGGGEVVIKRKANAGKLPGL